MMSPFNRTAQQISCNDNEYPHNGKCCKKCPEGTHVAEHCTSDHGQGECERCLHGDNYTEYPNGLDACLPCRYCRDDEVPVHDCTQTANTLCQCKPGTYCIPGQTCEICLSCRSAGIKLPCKPTRNTVCEDALPPETNTLKMDQNYTQNAMEETETGGMVPVVLVSVCIITGILLVIFVVVYKLKCKGKGKQPANANTGMEQLLQTENNHCAPSNASEEHELRISNSTLHESAYDPCVMEQLLQTENNHRAPSNASEENELRISNSTPHESAYVDIPQAHCAPQQISLNDWMNASFTDEMHFNYCCYNLIDNVPDKHWKEFMRRINLTDIEIGECSHYQGLREQKYQMLNTWRNKYGTEATIQKLLQPLHDMQQRRCVETIENTLKGH
ncbi:tumor necrosis factor receptor superfamily member 1A-like isoform X2 [Bombina bombina]|uniref:tumor necrosis factor receptor superfamily member 1A-like isoform X2 n=1 Tax=Bombina bombina TaxID=8345 RepID=UPI00235B0BD9|nr:tumor necrosis factor receptor superfamily member 1A-like isoform X2 [Bombina bombina]